MDLMQAHLIPHGSGILVLPWNVNTAEDIARTPEMGVDGVIVEDPLLV
jgi:glycerophosphoryl diester phosphodiesterase